MNNIKTLVFLSIYIKDSKSINI